MTTSAGNAARSIRAPRLRNAPCATAEERIGLCPGCEPQDGVEIVGRSEDGFEAIIRPRSKTSFRVQ